MDKIYATNFTLKEFCYPTLRYLKFNAPHKRKDFDALIDSLGHSKELQAIEFENKEYVDCRNQIYHRNARRAHIHAAADMRSVMKRGKRSCKMRKTGSV